MTEPIVCVPRANGTMPAATAAAEPLEDPPGVCRRSQRIDSRTRMPPGEFGRDRFAKNGAPIFLDLRNNPGVLAQAYGPHRSVNHWPSACRPWR